MGITPPERSASDAFLRSPLVQVKNFEDMLHDYLAANILLF